MGTCIMNCQNPANYTLKDIEPCNIFNKTTIKSNQNYDSNINFIIVKPKKIDKSNINLKTNEKLQFNVNSNKKNTLNDNIEFKIVNNKHVNYTNNDLEINNDGNSYNLKNLENRKNSLNGPIYKKLLKHRKCIKNIN